MKRPFNNNTGTKSQITSTQSGCCIVPGGYECSRASGAFGLSE